MTCLVLALALSAAPPVPVRHALGTLHGFPSMSDASGTVIADGELTQQLAGDRVLVRIRWAFADGRRVEERDELRTGAALVQERFSWVETQGGEELRRFEVDFTTGDASSTVRGADGHVERDSGRLELPRGRAFTGYGTALAVSQLALAPGEEQELTFVAFADAPRAVTLRVRREQGLVRIPVAGRTIPCDRYTLHPDLPFPIRLVARAKDAHLRMTRAAPPALVRAEQNLAPKDDPQVIVAVTPRGAARPPAAARTPPRR